MPPDPHFASPDVQSWAGFARLEANWSDWDAVGEGAESAHGEPDGRERRLPVGGPGLKSRQRICQRRDASSGRLCGPGASPRRPPHLPVPPPLPLQPQVAKFAESSAF